MDLVWPMQCRGDVDHQTLIWKTVTGFHCDRNGLWVKQPQKCSGFTVCKDNTKKEEVEIPVLRNLRNTFD